MPYDFEPLVAGDLGPDTVMDQHTLPPTVDWAQYEFFFPTTADLIESFPVFLVTEELAERFSTGELGWDGLLIFELPVLLVVGVYVRLLVTKVQVRGDRLRIVNVRRTYGLPLASIERFTMGSRGFFPRIGIAELRDGTSVAMFAIQGPNPATRPNNRSAEDAIDALNAHLRVGATA